MKPFYERNNYVINSGVNVCFEELLEMNEDQFREWVVEMRKTICDAWDAYGCPPRTGKNEEEIIEAWNKLESYPVRDFERDDELSDIPRDVIVNKSRMGVEADQFFDNLFKTRINYTEKDNGYSIYDLVSDPDREEQFFKGCKRHFRRDSFYSFALSAIKNDKKYAVIDVSSGVEWLETFFSSPDLFTGKDFILEQVKIRDGLNSGYFQLEQSKILQVTREDVQRFKDSGQLQYRHHSTFDIENMPEDKVYSIRIYDKGKKVFPTNFKAFRIGYIQPAVNFPPMTAKYLYERFTEDIKDQEVIKIYDPSAGWGGRILGAMSVRDDRNIHYIGTDPNVDNYLPDGSSKYSAIADLYNTKTNRANSFFNGPVNTYEVHCLGSEVIQFEEKFQKHKGEVDLVFTSPPYFNREAYSENENQSYKKFGSSYESWRDGFLRPTLETAVTWLKSERYLLWNIADILVSGKYLPLQEDTKNILEEYGVEYKYTLKMALEGMPGQNRVGEDGKPTCRNYCKVNGRYLKHEPVMVFWKP